MALLLSVLAAPQLLAGGVAWALDWSRTHHPSEDLCRRLHSSGEGLTSRGCTFDVTGLSACRD